MLILVKTWERLDMIRVGIQFRLNGAQVKMKWNHGHLTEEINHDIMVISWESNNLNMEFV